MKYPNDADGQALANVAASGIDMSQPVLVEFAIDARNESSARAIKDVLSSEGFKSELYFDEGEPDWVEGEEEGFGPSWTVYLKATIELSYENVVRIQDKIGQLVLKLGGKSDGWEVKLP